MKSSNHQSVPSVHVRIYALARAVHLSIPDLANPIPIPPTCHPLANHTHDQKGFFSVSIFKRVHGVLYILPPFLFARQVAVIDDYG